MSALLGHPVSEAVCEANSCKLLQVLSCLMGGQTYGRAREWGGDFRLKLSDFGKRLLQLSRACRKKQLNAGTEAPLSCQKERRDGQTNCLTIVACPLPRAL